MKQRNIDSKLLWVRFREFLLSLRPRHLIAWGAIVALVVTISTGVYFFAGGKTQSAGAVYGEAISAFLHQSKYRRVTQMTVRLDTGQHVSVNLPNAAVYQPHARVKLEVITRTSNAGNWVAYRFAGYADNGQESAVAAQPTN